jgi:hypothetical protein
MNKSIKSFLSLSLAHSLLFMHKCFRFHYVDVATNATAAEFKTENNKRKEKI